MPRVIAGARLTKSQLARLDACIANLQGTHGRERAFAICIANFKKHHKLVRKGGRKRWVRRNHGRRGLPPSP